MTEATDTRVDQIHTNVNKKAKLVRTIPGEVVSTPVIVLATEAAHTGLRPVNTNVDKLAEAAGMVLGGVACRPMNGTAPGDQALFDSQTPHPAPSQVPCRPVSKRAYTTAVSNFPVEIQCDIHTNGRSNRHQIQPRIDRLLRKHGLQDTPVQRLPLRGNVMIPAPKSMTSIPFWGFRAGGLIPKNLMDAVQDNLEAAEHAGCRPFINPLKKAATLARKWEREGLPHIQGGSRSDFEVPFHIGVFKHPNQAYHQPWISKDTLQGLKGDGPTRAHRITKMMDLCKSIDNIANGRVQNLVRHVAPGLLTRYREWVLTCYPRSRVLIVPDSQG